MGAASCGSSSGTTPPSGASGSPNTGASGHGGAGANATTGGSVVDAGAPTTGGTTTGGAATGGRAGTGGNIAAVAGHGGDGETGVNPETPECPLSEPLGTDEADGGSYDSTLSITSPGLEDLIGTYSTIKGDLLIGPVGPDGAPRIEQIDLSHVRVVEGSLLIRNTGLTELSMPRLETVSGQLWISLNLELSQVSLPELRSTGDFFLDANVSLLASEFPKLETVNGQLYIHRNIELVSWGLDALHTVTGGVTITANPALPFCLVDALGAATGLTLSSEFRGDVPPPACDCSRDCGRLVPECG